MVRIGKYVLFEKAEREQRNNKALDPLEESPTVAIMNQQIGQMQEQIKELKNEIGHQNIEKKQIWEMQVHIKELKNEIERLKSGNIAKITKEKYTPSEDLKDAIVHLVTKEPLTSTEIRERVKANANRTTRALKELQVEGKVEMRKDGRKKLYYTKNTGKNGKK
jgi:predicted Rossmann fold nucleotide-binding protein DprA/Smf involved in DNA uptake